MKLRERSRANPLPDELARADRRASLSPGGAGGGPWSEFVRSAFQVGTGSRRVAASDVISHGTVGVCPPAAAMLAIDCEDDRVRIKGAGTFTGLTNVAPLDARSDASCS